MQIITDQYNEWNPVTSKIRELKEKGVLEWFAKGDENKEFEVETYEVSAAHDDIQNFLLEFKSLFKSNLVSRSGIDKINHEIEKEVKPNVMFPWMNNLNKSQLIKEITKFVDFMDLITRKCIVLRISYKMILNTDGSAIGINKKIIVNCKTKLLLINFE